VVYGLLTAEPVIELVGIDVEVGPRPPATAY
jgi:hypothetical protein